MDAGKEDGAMTGAAASREAASGADDVAASFFAVPAAASAEAAGAGDVAADDDDGCVDNTVIPALRPIPPQSDDSPAAAPAPKPKE
jgi:hypothetical protein